MIHTIIFLSLAAITIYSLWCELRRIKQTENEINKAFELLEAQYYESFLEYRKDMRRRNA